MCFKLLTFLIFFASNMSSAAVSLLVKEFIKNNRDVLSAKKKIDKSLIDFELIKSKKAWIFSFDTTSYDNSLESTSSSSEMNSFSNTATISKSYDWGGSFSLENNLNKITVPSSSLSPQQKYFEFYQSLTFSQKLGRNFLGRVDKNEIQAVNQAYLVTKLGVDKSIQKLIKAFYANLVIAQLNKTLMELQVEAKKRSTRRLSLISRRVRDGLREKVDLLQAESANLLQTENVKTSKLNFFGSRVKLSEMLHRDILEDEVWSFNFEESLSKIPKGDLKRNLDVLINNQTQRIDKLNLKMKRFSLVPDLSLNAIYKTNNFDGKSGTAFSDGMLGSEQNAFTINLNLSWSIGFTPQKLEIAKQNIDVMINKKEGEVIVQNAFYGRKNIYEKINSYSANIKSIRRRMYLAKASLNELNKLYNLGRADLDQVIRAEEDLINTQKMFAQYISEREQAVTSLAEIFGDLENYLMLRK